MRKRMLIFVIASLFINISFSIPTYGKPTDENEGIRAEKARRGIQKLGTGADAHVSVKLDDGKHVKGYVSSANDQSFVVTDSETRVSTEIPYEKAKQIKGNNLSTGAKIAIGVGIVVLIIVIAGFLGRSS